MIFLTFYKVFYNRFSKNNGAASFLSYASIDLVIFLLINIPINVVCILTGKHYSFLPTKGSIVGAFLLAVLVTRYMMQKIFKTEELPKGIDNKFQITSVESRMVWSIFIFSFIVSMGMAVLRKYLETGL